MSITDSGKLRLSLPLKERLEAVYPLEEMEGEPAYLEEVIDTHTQTDGSDGDQTSGELLDEAYGNGLYLIGVSDHANVGNEPKTYRSSFYGLELDDIKGESFTEVYPDRYDAIQDNIEDMKGVVSWQDADIDKLVEDLDIIRQYGSDYAVEELRENVLNYNMVVMNAFEPDFNPLIETNDDSEEAVEEYIESLKDFVIEAESYGAGFDHVNQAVHDVFIDGKFRYVKKPELFEHLSTEDKEEVLETYREKLVYAIEDVAPAMKEMGEEIGAGLKGEGLTVSIAHPAIIERNEELMQVFNDSKKEEAVEETQEFIYGHREIPVEGNKLIEDEETDKFLDETDIEKIYPETALREFWQPVVESMEDAENVVLEINGKHVERFYKSILWEMIDEGLHGSDQHREGEQKSRSRKAKNLDLEADLKTPIDLLVENLES